ncbi:hypothetical protein RBI22_15310 [Alcaligenaceae bacterium C4P045]|nr:hypothetical protein [Alcaligenaceae bacterium C4P045]
MKRLFCKYEGYVWALALVGVFALAGHLETLHDERIAQERTTKTAGK